MKIRGNGSIIPMETPERNCRRWQLRVSVGYDYANKGEYKTRYRTKTRNVRGTKTQAKAELRKFIAELQDGQRLDATSVTLGEFAGQWLEERKANKVNSVRKGTLRGDDVRVRTIQAALGSMRLVDVDEQTVSAFYTHLMDGSASLSGKPLSGTTARKVAVTLNQILKRAVRLKYINHNPCSILESWEKPQVDTKEREPLSDGEAALLVSKLYEGEPDAHRIGITLALECGMRREEFLAVTWGDLDFANGIIHIQHAYSVDDLELTGTKSASGDRRFVVGVGSPVYNRLMEWRRIQAGKLSKLGMAQGPNTPIVTSRTGGFVHPNNFYRWWCSYCDKIGLRRCGLHTLRHTYATALGRQGVDLKTLQYLLGDKTGLIALNVYQHYSEGNGKRAMSAVSGFYHGELKELGGGSETHTEDMEGAASA